MSEETPQQKAINRIQRIFKNQKMSYSEALAVLRVCRTNAVLDSLDRGRTPEERATVAASILSLEHEIDQAVLKMRPSLEDDKSREKFFPAKEE